jgi:hypothetical protein
LILSSIVVGHDACLQLGELVLASPNADMANFLYFDVNDIDLSQLENNATPNNFILKKKIV